ncbi:MAG: PAS domain-containing protein [Hyphomicrobium denitrificans]|nr:PAS domain-containing protein [Hyphomicrobium denitrificans]
MIPSSEASVDGDVSRPSENALKITETESPFELGELFFSRTESRGRIQSGNAVFQRVSEYPWAEMMDRPHNIIRHPDMPRAVFFVLWEQIRAGHPVGAYVKNRAKNGNYYWVYAVVTPIDGGYLSVRLKPSSDLFAAASTLYKSARRNEITGAIKPADSAAALVHNLRASGFRDYPAFMTAALSREMRERNAAMGRPAWRLIDLFDNLVSAADTLLSTTDRMLAMISTFNHTPTNLRIQALRLGDKGRAIAEISSNYDHISKAIVTNLQDLETASNEVFSGVNEGLFLACTARLQDEMASLFDQEVCDDSDAASEEAKRLRQQTDDYKARAAAKFELIKVRIGHFFDLTSEMKRLLSGLIAVRVMGKVESVGLSNGIFSDLIADLEQGQQTLTRGLENIAKLNDRIRETVVELDTLT